MTTKRFLHEGDKTELQTSITAARQIAEGASTTVQQVSVIAQGAAELAEEAAENAMNAYGPTNKPTPEELDVAPEDHTHTPGEVGLGNVPNVSTNNQTPTYNAATSLTGLTSGERLSVAFGKISKAITDLISHINNKSNPHGATAAQVGAVPTSRKVNNKSLNNDISLTAGDVGTYSAEQIDNMLEGVAPDFSINGKSPDEYGEIYLSASDVGAILSTLPEITDANISIAESNPTGIKFERWSKTTLNTPYTQGLTTRSDGVVITSVIKGTFATQLAFPIGGRGLYIRHNIVGSIYAWTEYGDFKSDGSVPLTGTVLNISNGEGSFENNGISASIKVRNVANDDSNSVSFVLDNSFYTAPYRKLLLRETVNGKNTDYRLYGEHNKPTASDVGAEPISGNGFLPNGTNFTTLDSKNGWYTLHSNYSYTGFPTDVNGQWGILDIKGSSATLVILNTDKYYFCSNISTGAWVELIDIIDKPRGGYTGNGSASTRTIDTHGEGNIALVFCSSYGFSLVTPHGAITKTTSGTSITGVASSSVNFVEGVLTIATANSAFNENGKTYYYQIM